MRVRLKNDNTEFVQQISAVRSFIGGIHARGGYYGDERVRLAHRPIAAAWLHATAF